MGKNKLRLKLTDGVVVWARLDTFPWWPSVIINRTVHEANLDPGESLPPATKENRMVEFFNDNQRVAVVEVRCLLEYTTNMKKIDAAPVPDKLDVLQAVAEAKEYIETRGIPEQKASLQEWEESKRTVKRKKSQRVPVEASDNEDAAPPKTKTKIKKERPRSFSPSKKRDSAKHREDDDIPRPKRMKSSHRRKSTGSTSKKAVSSKKHKSKSRDENLPATSETKEDQNGVEGLTAKAKADESTLVKAKMDIDELEGATPIKDDDKLSGDTVKMETGPEPRSPNRSSAYIDVVAGTKEASVDHILKKPKPIPENTIRPDSIKVVSQAIAEEVCDAVVSGAADYVKGIMEIARMRDELQQQMYKLQDKRDKLLKDIRELDGRDFTMQMLIDSGIGVRLVATVDELRPHAVDPHNELIRVLNKWRGRALDADAKDERRKGGAGTVDEEEVLDRNDERTASGPEHKKASKAAKKESDTAEDDISALSGERKGDKSSAFGGPGTAKNRAARQKSDKERSAEKSSKSEDKKGSAGKSSKSEQEGEAPSKITRASSAKSLDPSDSPVKKAKPAKWESFSKSKCLGVLKSTLTSYLTMRPPPEEADAQELSVILQDALAAKCGDDKKLYFYDCKKVCGVFVEAARSKDEESRKHVVAFLESRDPVHVIPASVD